MIPGGQSELPKTNQTVSSWFSMGYLGKDGKLLCPILDIIFQRDFKNFICCKIRRFNSISFKSKRGNISKLEERSF
jgi:hypothetical protein